MKVSVVGLGKAGLPLAMVMADAGLEVVGIDVDKARVDWLNSGKNPIPEEPELGDLITKHAGKGFKASADYSSAADCAAHIVIVPLFIDGDHKPDFSIMEDAFVRLAGILKDGDLIVLETTVPPGTTEGMIKQILDRSEKKYLLAHSPERIMTGYSVSRYREFPKVVGGVDEASGKAALDLYSRFCASVNLVSNAKTAELIKISEGIYRDVNIALANELFKVCESEGVDYYELRKNANHAFCNLHLPGNVGGHCIPVYPWFLIDKFEVPLIEKARKINDDMIVFYADEVAKRINSGKVLVVGLSYREGVKETAYSRTPPFVNLLKDKGYDVYVYDPMFSKEEIEKKGLAHMAEASFGDADVVIVMNDYNGNIPELGRIDKSKIIRVKGESSGME